MSKFGRRESIFLVLCILFIFALFLRTSPAVIVTELMVAFNVPAAALGLMSSSFFYAYAFAQVPIGFLSDRIGVRRTVMYFGLVGCIGTIMFAFSPAIQMAAWARILTGAGTAGVWIPALKYLSVSYQPDEFAIFTSIINAIGGLGLLLATLPMALLVESIGWRNSYMLAGALMAVLVLTAWQLMKTHPSTSTKNKNDSKNFEKNAVSLKHSFYFLKNSTFWLFFFWAFLYYGVLFSFIGLWGASYLQDTFDISRNRASLHLLFTTLGMMGGGLVWGLLSDRYFRARKPILLLGTLGTLAAWVLFAFLPVYPGFFWASILYFAVGLFGIVFLINLGCVKELFPLEIAGTAMGTVNAAMFLGVAFFQGVTGYLLDSITASDFLMGGYHAIFFFYLAGIILALLMVLLMPETFPGKQTKKMDSTAKSPR